MSLASSFQLPLSRPHAGRVAKLWFLIKAVRNWPRTLMDHFGISRGDYICHLRSGLAFHVRGGTDDRHVIFELFALPIYPVLLRPGDVVVDVGAQIGCFSMLAARRGATVLSYEPFAANFLALERNLRLNGATQVSPFQVAVTGRGETRPMYLPDNADFTGRFSLFPSRGTTSVEATCVSLAGVVEEHRLARIDLLKIDCQGSEYEILYGTDAETFRRIRAIVVECEVFDTPAEWSVTSLQRFLESVGYETARVDSILYAAREGEQP